MDNIEELKEKYKEYRNFPSSCTFEEIGTIETRKKFDSVFVECLSDFVNKQRKK